MTEPPPDTAKAKARAGLMKVHVALILVHLGYAGYQVLSSLVLKSGLSSLIFLLYRDVIALVFLIPVAFYSERCIF